jgi:hypothetical protein
MVSAVPSTSTRVAPGAILAEAALRQSLVVNDESVSVPEEDLYAVASATKEHEQVAFVRVELPRVPHEPDEPVVPTAKVDRLGGEVDAHTRGQVDHWARIPETTAAT